MIKKTFITLTLCTLAFAVFSQAFVKGTGIRYDRGVPTVAPDTTYGTEYVIDLLTRDIYQWDRDNEQWLLSSNLARPVVETLDTALSFTYTKYYSVYSASSDLTFTADTTNGKYGAYTIARIDFDTVPVTFSGTAFDSVQFYNIASGDTLIGIHMVYFENTPYGVAVSVPTNNRTTQDTITGGGGGGGSPALEKSGGLVEFDGLLDLTDIGDTIKWIDQINGVIAKNPTAASKPANVASGVVFTPLATGDYLELDSSIVFDGDISMTIAWNVANEVRPFASIIGQVGDATSFDMARKRWDGGITAFQDVNITTPGDSLQLGPEVVQISCVSGSSTCEVWINNVSIGTDTYTVSTPQLYDMIGAFNETGEATPGTIYYISAHDSAYTTQEQQDFFDYVNTRFSLGL